MTPADEAGLVELVTKMVRTQGEAIRAQKTAAESLATLANQMRQVLALVKALTERVDALQTDVKPSEG